VRRLTEAIANGGPLDTLVAQLKTEEDRKKALARELEALGAVHEVASLDAARITRDLRARVADVKGLLARRKPQARQMLRRGEGTFGRLLSGEAFEALPRTVVAPTGHVRTYIIQVRHFIAH
jgi:hypothetical protein